MTKIKKYWANLLFVAIWGIFLVGVIVMVSQPKVDSELSTVNLEQVESNSQYFLKTTCYVATGNLTYDETIPQSNHTVAIRFNSKVVQNMGLEIGDRIYIEDYGTYYVEDRIPDYQKADLDIFMDSLEECKQFGRRNLIVERL